MQRFFTAGGAPLSAELDRLLRQVIQCGSPPNNIKRVKWIFLGTERVRRYFETIRAPKVAAIASLCAPKVHDGESVRGWYPSRVMALMKESAKSSPDASDTPFSFAAEAIIKTRLNRMAGLSVAQAAE